MKTIQEIKKILVQHKDKLRKQYGVRKIGVFGSLLEENKKINDVDILVEFDRSIGFFKFIDLENHLEKLIRKRVDLVSKKALKPYIGKQILNKVLYL